MLDLLRTPARSKRGALGIKHPCVECVLEVAFPAVNVVNAENACSVLSWVGGMVNISPESLDVVPIGGSFADSDRGGF